MEERHYLYRITNNINGKVYIGVTNNPKRRRQQHFYGSLQQASLPRKAVEKYGEDALDFDVLVVGSRSYVLDLEEKFIEHYRNCGNCYNIASGGESGNLGREISVRSDDKPCYVLGFWFPNRRIAAKSLNKGKTTIYRNLNKEIETKQTVGRERPKRGSEEDTLKRSESMQGKNSGQSNGMSGRLGGKHPRARAIAIHGIKYDSISDAVRKTELTKSIIEKSLKKQKDGFRYLSN